jgi:hypothetical protein
MFNEQTKDKKKCVCGYEGKNFAEIVFVLNDSAILFGTKDENNKENLKVKKVLKMYACPQCKTLQVAGI